MLKTIMQSSGNSSFKNALHNLSREKAIGALLLGVVLVFLGVKMGFFGAECDKSKDKEKEGCRCIKINSVVLPSVITIVLSLAFVTFGLPMITSKMGKRRNNAYSSDGANNEFDMGVEDM